MDWSYFYVAIFYLLLSLISIDAQRNRINVLRDPKTIEPANTAEPLDGKNHPCYRKCDGVPKTCYYHFQMEWYNSMSKACFKCPENLADCERKDCIVINGVRRQVTTVNRKMPGPFIEVCQNDMVIVNVTNDLMGATTTIHWHGMHMRDTPYMDGVPFVTQCPIQPESTFTYKFNASQAGTHFWHSHIGLQRGDGVTGALIVRQPKKEDRTGKTFDFDMAEHVMLIQDWHDDEAQSVYTSHYHGGGSMAPRHLLINGRGKFDVKIDKPTPGTIVSLKAPRFNVNKFFRYRFRFINAGFSYCPVELFVDGHEITVISTDGHYLEPVKARSFVSYDGERFDFVVHADQPVANYWIRVRGLKNCERQKIQQVAVLHYRGADDEEPKGWKDWNPRIQDKLEINTENMGDEQDKTTTMSMLRYPDPTPAADITLKPVPDYKLYIAFDLFPKNNEFFNKEGLYEHDQVREINRRYSVALPQINHITMKLPDSPLLVSRPPDSAFCNGSSIPKTCEIGFCRCHHVLTVKLNTVVEVILIDEGKDVDANHPFHLHGHNFRVIGQRSYLADNKPLTLEKVMVDDKAGKIKRNLDDRPPIKDTVTVPHRGLTILRFHAINPGYWIFHCHIEFHADVGMALVFKVGEHDDMLPVPNNFPTCGTFANNGAPAKNPNNGPGAGNNGNGAGNNGNGMGNKGNGMGNNGNGMGNNGNGMGNNGNGMGNNGNGMGNNGNGMGNNGPGTLNDFYARIAQHYQAYHSVVAMPMGGQMEVVYKLPRKN